MRLRADRDFITADGNFQTAKQERARIAEIPESARVLRAASVSEASLYLKQSCRCPQCQAQLQSDERQRPNTRRDHENLPDRSVNFFADAVELQCEFLFEANTESGRKSQRAFRRRVAVEVARSDADFAVGTTDGRQGTVTGVRRDVDGDSKFAAAFAGLRSHETRQHPADTVVIPAVQHFKLSNNILTESFDSTDDRI